MGYEVETFADPNHLRDWLHANPHCAVVALTETGDGDQSFYTLVVKMPGRNIDAPTTQAP